ncbi:zinc-ribbon domain-containing protein, partial [Roseateles sp. P5_E1]
MSSVAATRHAVPSPTTPRAFSCACGRPVFFRNSECLACHRPLGYAPARGQLLALEAAPRSG